MIPFGYRDPQRAAKVAINLLCANYLLSSHILNPSAMNIINLSEQNSVLNNFIGELRDVNIQKDSMRFRRNLERIGEIFAYEISKQLKYEKKEVQTPLGIAEVNVVADELVIGTVLRAGLPLHNGILNIFDKAQNCFMASYRKCGKDNKFTIQLEYVSSPSVDGKVLVLADSMLATGSTIVLAYQRLKEEGDAKHTHIVCPVASREGIEYLSKNLPHRSVTMAIDEELTNKSYIVPGLGDAGDLAYGMKK